MHTLSIHSLDLLLGALFFSAPSRADYKIFQLGSPLIPTAANSRCRVALTTNIACDPLLQATVGGGAMNLTQARLDEICTSNCGTSIKSYATGVRTQCGSSLYVNSTASQQTPLTDYGDENWWKYNVTCLKSSSGSYCQLDTNECSTCSLQSRQLELNSPYGQPRFGNPDTFANLKRSCSVATNLYPLTYTASAAPTATASACSKSYTSKEGDTCNSIAKAQSVSTGALIAINSLDAGCKYLTAGVTLCLPKTCALHTVRANETCLDVVTLYSNNTLFSEPQLLAWNKGIDPHCENLRNMVGETICVSPPGSTAPPNWQQENETIEVPKPENGHQQSNKPCGKWHTVIAGEGCGNLTFTYSTKISDLSFLNPGLRSDCTNLESGKAYCVKPVGSIRQYDGWSPVLLPTDVLTATMNLGSPGNNRSHTYLWPNATATTAITITQNIPAPAITSRWNSYSLCPDFGATNPDFENGNIPWYAFENEEWMSVYDAYCVIGGNGTIPTASPTWPKLDVPLTAVPAPAPTNSGAPTDCLKWAVVSTGMNTCSAIASSNNITVTAFREMNPWINAQCTNLWAGNAYCVDRIANHQDPISELPPSTSVTTTRSTTTTSRASTTTTTTSSSNSGTGTPVQTLAPPGPTETGTSSACTRWHVFKTGETCTRVLVTYNIKLPAFQALNPIVNSACNNLVVGNAYCINGA